MATKVEAWKSDHNGRLHATELEALEEEFAAAWNNVLKHLPQCEAHEANFWNRLGRHIGSGIYGMGAHQLASALGKVALIQERREATKKGG